MATNTSDENSESDPPSPVSTPVQRFRGKGAAYLAGKGAAYPKPNDDDDDENSSAEESSSEEENEDSDADEINELKPATPSQFRGKGAALSANGGKFRGKGAIYLARQAESSGASESESEGEKPEEKSEAPVTTPVSVLPATPPSVTNQIPNEVPNLIIKPKVVRSTVNKSSVKPKAPTNNNSASKSESKKRSKPAVHTPSSSDRKKARVAEPTVEELLCDLIPVTKKVCKLRHWAADHPEKETLKKCITYLERLGTGVKQVLSRNPKAREADLWTHLAGLCEYRSGDGEQLKAVFDQLVSEKIG